MATTIITDTVKTQQVDIAVLLTSRCVYCASPAEGNYSIHRDGFGIGPEVPLCDTCGSGEEPTLDAIWARISE